MGVAGPAALMGTVYDRQDEIDYYNLANATQAIDTRFFPKIRFQARNIQFLDTLLLQLQEVDTTGGLGNFQIELREVSFDYDNLRGNLPAAIDLLTEHNSRLVQRINLAKGGALTLLTDALAVHIGAELEMGHIYDLILQPLSPALVPSTDFYNLRTNTLTNVIATRPDIYTFWSSNGGREWNRPTGGALPLPIVLEGYNKLRRDVAMDVTGFLYSNRASRIYNRAVTQALDAVALRDICSWKYVGDCQGKTFTVVETNVGAIAAMQLYGCIVQDNNSPLIFPIGAANSQPQNTVRAYYTTIRTQYIKIRAIGAGSAYATLEAW